MTPEEKITELGLTLPAAAAPIGSYLNAVRTGNLIHVSGGLPIVGDEKYFGRIPDQCDIDRGKKAAALALLTRLAVLKEELGELSKITRIVSLTGYVASTPDFTDHPAVINGASDLLVEIFGEAGKHSRAAVGVSSLPLGVSVEVSLIAEVSS